MMKESMTLMPNTYVGEYHIIQHKQNKYRLREVKVVKGKLDFPTNAIKF